MQLFSFTTEETTILLELARRATADADLFDEMAGKLDVADSDLSALCEKLHFALEYPQANIQLNTREEDEYLVYDGQTANDYILAEGRTNAWITVDGVSVKVSRREDHVIAEMFRTGSDYETVLAECSLNDPM